MSVKHIHSCNGCRQRKEIVLFVRGMRYCEQCRDSAPTKQALKDYMTTNSVKNLKDWRHEGRAKLA